MPKLIKGSQQARDYMKSIRDKRGMKGKGIVSDLLNKGKDILIEEGKNQLVNVIDKGADVIKRKVRGKGLFGNIAKSIGSNLIDALPGPNFVKAGLKFGAEKLIDKTGLGIVKVKNVNKKVKVNNKIVNGLGLAPAGLY